MPKVLDGPSSPVNPDREAHGVEPIAYMGDALEPLISGETKRNESARWRCQIFDKVNGEHPRIIRLRMQSHLDVGRLMGIGIIPRN